jgi:hypothetical protein
LVATVSRCIVLGDHVNADHVTQGDGSHPLGRWAGWDHFRHPPLSVRCPSRFSFEPKPSLTSIDTMDRLDIIKTRLQTATVALQSHPHPPRTRPLSVRQVARQIYADEINAQRYRYPNSTVFRLVARVVRDDNDSHVKAEKWSLRLLGLKGFARGIRPTALSSFVGSSVTILAFEVILEALRRHEAG